MKKVFTIIGLIMMQFIITFTLTVAISPKHTPNPYDHIGKRIIIDEDTLIIIQYLPNKHRYVLSNGIQITFKE
jgi:hypothetical protein